MFDFWNIYKPIRLHNFLLSLIRPQNSLAVVFGPLSYRDDWNKRVDKQSHIYCVLCLINNFQIQCVKGGDQVKHKASGILCKNFNHWATETC